VRSVNLLRVAAEAELLRLRTMLARQGRRAAFGAVAVIFVIGVLVLGEVAGWQVLRLYVAPISATLILLGINVVIAGAFGSLAARSTPGHVEIEALRVRRQSLDAASWCSGRDRGWCPWPENPGYADGSCSTSPRTPYPILVRSGGLASRWTDVGNARSRHISASPAR
jgi:hypothetical protein